MDDKEAFTKKVIKAVKHLDPNASVEVVGPNLVIAGNNLDIDSVYRYIKTHKGPETPDELLPDFIRAFLKPKPSKETLDDVATRIYPRIYSNSLWDRLNKDYVPHIEFGNATNIIFVVDDGPTTINVQRHDMERWGVDIDKLYEMAIQNLEAISYGVESELLEAKSNKSCGLCLGDSYDSSRILLPSIHELLRERFNGDCLVGIPSRDTFLACPVGPSTVVNVATKGVKQLFESLPFPISPKLFLITRDGVAGD